jgi:hypothetical protein
VAWSALQTVFCQKEGWSACQTTFYRQNGTCHAVGRLFAGTERHVTRADNFLPVKNRPSCCRTTFCSENESLPRAPDNFSPAKSDVERVTDVYMAFVFSALRGMLKTEGLKFQLFLTATGQFPCQHMDANVRAEP